MLTIVILNYNGWHDTIDCLMSLRQQTYRDFRVIVADNGSSDDSVLRLRQWAETSHANYKLLKDGKQTTKDNAWLYILPFAENHGFAKGNNRAIAALSYKPSDYILCLNNDTIVAADCLERLVEYANNNSDIEVLTPGIRLYDKPDYMWSAGGKLVFGGRKDICPLQPATRLKGRKIIPITFITGCALFFRSELINEQPLFTERFFFGEEDFNFSLRMRDEKRKMICLMDAIVYHKVSASQAQVVSYNKLFIYLLNRIIDLRTYYSLPKYALWISMYVPFIWMRFLQGLSYTKRCAFLHLLLHEAATHDGVSKEMFEKYIHYSFTE